VVQHGHIWRGNHRYHQQTLFTRSPYRFQLFDSRPQWLSQVPILAQTPASQSTVIPLMAVLNSQVQVPIQQLEPQISRSTVQLSPRPKRVITCTSLGSVYDLVAINSLYFIHYIVHSPVFIDQPMIIVHVKLQFVYYIIGIRTIIIIISMFMLCILSCSRMSIRHHTMSLIHHIWNQINCLSS
jgi:hypothetical protein